MGRVWFSSTLLFSPSEFAAARDRSRKAFLRPASGRVDLPQQPHENVTFIRPQPNSGIHHLDQRNILPLRVPKKRKRTRRAYRPEEIRLRALHSVGQVEVVHRRQIELNTALRLEHIKGQS